MVLTVTWTGLREMADNVHQRADQLPQAVGAGLAPIAGELASYMKSNHPWQNRSGAAERGLAADYLDEGMVQAIVAYGTVHYQIYLELGTSKMAPRSIIMPGIHAHLGQVRALMDRIAGRG